jgi:MATE family multidrug resistance protein
MLIFWKIYPILILLGQQPHLARIAEKFYHANIWRVAPVMLCVCNQQLCYAVHKQKVDMLANMSGVLVLLVFSYVLIFGKLGFPALGVAGFGYASALQALFYLIVTTSAFYFIADFKPFLLFQFRLHHDWRALKKLLKIGWPISLQISGEMLSLLVGATLIGWLGTSPLAAYQVITQYQFLIVVPIFAISQATGILVGQAYGSKQFTIISQLARESVRLSVTLSLLMGALCIFFPTTLASLYLDIHDPANVKTLHLIRVLFIAMAIFIVFDAAKNVLTGALRGLLDTKYPMFVGLSGIWIIGVPVGYLMAFQLQLGAVGLFIGWTIGMVLSAIILYFRWQQKISAW